MRLFFSTFILIFVAELPDKTALATLLMATRGNPRAIFTGAALAFVIQSLVAVALGSVLSFFPARWVHFTAGVLFLVFAVLVWRREEDEEKEEEVVQAVSGSRRFWRTAWGSFLVIFAAEWGDLTQLATASLAAKYRDPITIFFAATLALWVVTGIAVVAGHRAKRFLHPRILKWTATLVFLGAGVYFLVDSFKTIR